MFKFSDIDEMIVEDRIDVLRKVFSIITGNVAVFILYNSYTSWNFLFIRNDNANPLIYTIVGRKVCSQRPALMVHEPSWMTA
jgi:hypothetical protein